MAKEIIASEEVSLGRLVSDAAADVQKLVRQEVALAKAEMRAEAGRAGKAAGMFGGAGFAGYMVVILLSFAAVIGLGHLLGTGWAAMIVAGIWAVTGAVMAATGRYEMRRFSPTPHRTVETLKEDAQWMRHPLTARADGGIAPVAARTPTVAGARAHAVSPGAVPALESSGHP